MTAGRKHSNKDTDLNDNALGNQVFLELDGDNYKLVVLVVTSSILAKKLQS